MREGAYDTAQICENGHVVNSSHEGYPEYGSDFCESCGARTMTACPSCGGAIRGAARSHLVVRTPPAPSYCVHCGAPFPWTTSRLKAAREYALELEALTSEERQSLACCLEDLVGDTPRALLAATRFEKHLAKAGCAAADTLRRMLIDLASEATRSRLWPQPKG